MSYDCAFIFHPLFRVFICRIGCTLRGDCHLRTRHTQIRDTGLVFVPTLWQNKIYHVNLDIHFISVGHCGFNQFGTMHISLNLSMKSIVILKIDMLHYYHPKYIFPSMFYIVHSVQSRKAHHTLVKSLDLITPLKLPG